MSAIAKHSTLVSVENDNIEAAPEIGSWWWVSGDGKPWLGCVTHVGSNFAEIVGVSERRYYSPPSDRIHLDEFHVRCKPEPNAESKIGERIGYHRSLAQKLMEEIKTLTGRLGISIAALPSVTDAGTQAIALRSGNGPIEEYKASLEKAKTKTLPDLFKRIEEENEIAAGWMTAQLLPLKAQAAQMKPAIKRIERQIFNVELYAGLVEKVEQIADGEPAELSTPVHLFQRRAYMDEECLANYKAGGMTFKNINAFDRWIAKRENRNRLLPFDRCMLAFRVRRNLKEIDTPSLSAFIKLFYEQDLDKLTFLYIRNGERLYRLRTKIEFGEDLFPDLTHIEESGVLFGMFEGYECKKIVSVGEVEDWQRRKEAYDAYRKLSWDEQRKTLHPSFSSSFERYEPYDKDSVFYDDITAFIEEETARHNRLVLILQGLLDRSPVLHPHPPWRLWTPEGFATGLRLIYDNSRAIAAGDAPDFEEYRRRLNARLKTGSVTTGQEDYWERVEARKESERMDGDWRVKGDWRPKRLRPQGDPGPGLLACVENFRRGAGTCTYRWSKDRQREAQWRHRRSAAGAIARRVTVPVAEVLNVDAYKPGDFHIFFDDPRTRAGYLQWAPLLLAAEDYHAGKRKVGEESE